MISLLDLQVGIAGVLLGASVVSLGFTAQWAWRTWQDADVTRGDLLSMLGILAAAIAVRLALPVRLATVFIGYRTTTHAIDLAEVQHYGFGAPVLYNAVFQFFDPDHLTLMRTNTALGILLIPLAATWGLQLLRDRRAGLLVGLLIAVLPIFVRNDTSDANNVPCLLWLFAGLVTWHRALTSGRSLELLAALPLLALAAIGRPELPLLVPVYLALSAWAEAPWRQRLGLRPLVGAGVVWLLLVSPHMAHILGRALWLQASDSLPGFSLLEIEDPWKVFHERTILFRWDLLPAAIPILAAAALWRPPAGGQKVERALILMALLTIVPTMIDVDRANIARVQVPVVLFLLFPAAAGLLRIGDRFGRRWGHGALVAAIALTAIPTGVTLFAPTNGDHEESLFAEARARLPTRPHTLVVRWDGDHASGDESGRRTHLHLPGYWFQPPGGSSWLRSIQQWMVTEDLSQPTFFLRTVRCYARFRAWEAPPAEGENLCEPCRRILEGYDLRPVFEREVPNRGNVWINYYGDAPTLTLGLYEILGPRVAP
ncbi:MAG: glycosyltransferase family 39 protein [Pseudomonadota bacterium]